MEAAFSVSVFVLFAALWLGFAIAMVISHGSLDSAWQWIRSLPLLVEIIVWFLFLPVVLGLWIWETGWPIGLRLLLVGSIGVWNVWMFFPRLVFGR